MTRLDDVDRQWAIVWAHYARAVEAAAEHDSDGFARQGEGRGSSSGSVVEAAVLRGPSRERLRLEAEVEAVLVAVQRLAVHCVRLAPPRVRNDGAGRVVVDCGNVYGCPEGKRARRQGLCDPCWWFREAAGRDRTVQDMADQLERARMGTRDRVARHRSKT